LGAAGGAYSIKDDGANAINAARFKMKRAIEFVSTADRPTAGRVGPCRDRRGDGTGGRGKNTVPPGDATDGDAATIRPR